jgi:hypothetical protein
MAVMAVGGLSADMNGFAQSHGMIVAATWRSVVLAAVSVALIGCKDVGRDMAACKVKAIEIYSR